MKQTLQKGNKMSVELKNVEKKLAQLKATKEKEETKTKENIDKLTAKYNEDAEKLKATFESKKSAMQKDLDDKMNELKPQIGKFEQIRKKLESIERQMEALRLDINGETEQPKEEQEAEAPVAEETTVTPEELFEEQPSEPYEDHSQYNQYQY